MSDVKLGTIGWMDLTVPDAAAVRDFYKNVAGWEVSEIDMGGYQDYCMIPPGSADPVAGICHARGGNADIPPVWLLYITVADLSASIAAVEAGGGAVIVGPKPAGGGSFCVIRDPAGAISGLYQVGSAA